MKSPLADDDAITCSCDEQPTGNYETHSQLGPRYRSQGSTLYRDAPRSRQLHPPVPREQSPCPTPVWPIMLESEDTSFLQASQ
eukprot:scaffold45487_cov33-Prasinocladus_malaysianus.AAC.1